jgi:hypothetical protein
MRPAMATNRMDEGDENITNATGRNSERMLKQVYDRRKAKTARATQWPPKRSCRASLRGDKANQLGWFIIKDGGNRSDVSYSRRCCNTSRNYFIAIVWEGIFDAKLRGLCQSSLLFR